MAALVGALAATASLAHGQAAAPKPAQKGKKGTPKVVDISAELAALYSADVEGAARAAQKLGTLDAPVAHEALLDALAMGLAPPVAMPAMVALAAFPAPPDVTALRRYAGHHDPATRAAAISALAIYPDPKARAAVVAGLHDPASSVRTAAAGAAAKGRVRDAVEPLLLLLARGEEPAARALAQIADLDLARRLADQLGKAPDATLALCLGVLLRRTDFGPDTARVELVRAIAKIQDPAAISALTEYIDATPKTPPRASRAEAESVVDARLGGK